MKKVCVKSSLDLQEKLYLLFDIVVLDLNLSVLLTTSQ